MRVICTGSIMAKHVVAKAADIPVNGRMLVNVAGRAIAVFNVDGEWFGLLNRCPHQGGNLSAGRLVGLLESPAPGQYNYSRPGEILRCPWHGWEFDIRTGKSKCRPSEVGIRQFTVSLESGEQLKEQLSVETFDVSVEDEYVVIEL